jgi:hypothetical protein
MHDFVIDETKFPMPLPVSFKILVRFVQLNYEHYS